MRRRLRRRVPAVVWLLVLAQALITLGWTQLAPPWRAPDEPQHHDLVRVVRAESGWVDADRTLSRQITATFDPVGFRYSRVRELPALAADDVPGSAGVPFRELAADEPSGAGNWLWQHPPLHYVVTAGGLILGESLTPTHPPGFLAELAAARAISALLIAPLPLLVFAAARRLGASDPAGVGAAGLTLAVPQLAHIGGAVNNDNLLVLLVSAATLPLLTMATGDGRVRPAVGAGALFGAALLTKAFALIGVGVIPLAAVVGWSSRRRVQPAAARDATVQVVAGLATMAVVGGWWLARNVAVHGALVPHSYDPEPLAGADPSLTAWVSQVAPRYLDRFWGSFGWFQVTIPFGVALTATAAVAALVGVAVWRRRRDLAGLAVIAVALAPAATIGAGVLWRAWSLHAEYGYFPMVHGRYLLPGLVGVLAVAAVAVDGTWTRRWWPPAVAVAAATMTGVAVATAAAAFWVGDGWAAVTAIAAWSPWPGWLAGLWAAATVGVVGALAALVAIAAVRRRPDASRAEPDQPSDAHQPAPIPPHR